MKVLGEFGTLAGFGQLADDVRLSNLARQRCKAIHTRLVVMGVKATLGHTPVASMVPLQGVDCFMSEARAITNTIGSAVATMAIARWVGAIDEVRMHRVLNGESTDEGMRSLYKMVDAPERAAVPVTAEITAIHKASA